MQLKMLPPLLEPCRALSGDPPSPPPVRVSAVPRSSVRAAGRVDLTPLCVPEPEAVSLRDATSGQSAKFILGVMISAGQDCLEVKIIHACVCKECRQGYAFPGTTRSCGWEVKTALSKLTLIKRTQNFLLITLRALNIGQAGWVSQCKINQSYMKNPRATFQLTKFSL